MRLLHTSDWHLGRSLHRAGLLEAQSAFLDHLVATVRSERIDAVLIAGDVYDRAVPSADALALCEDGLIRLRDAGARVVAISGNHDSARRLGFGSRLLDAAGVHLRTRVAALAAPVLLDDRRGTVAVYGVPYLEPNAVRAELPPAPACAVHDGPGHDGPGHDGPGQDGPGRDGPTDCDPGHRYFEDGDAAHRDREDRDREDRDREDRDREDRGGREPVDGHRAVLGHAAACIRGDIAARGVTRSVVLAHAWVTGGSVSDSERDISVGGAGSVPASLFRGFSYVALGHLHGQQTLDDHLRYSGSPLPYSFSEATHRKGSWLVELDAAGPARAVHVPAPSLRRLTVLRGMLDELLTSPAFGDHERDFVSVTLTDAVRPDAAMDRLRTRFPHILVLSFEPGHTDRDTRSYRARITGRADLAVAAGFVEHVRGAPVTGGERALLTAAFEAARRDEDADQADGPAAAGVAGTAGMGTAGMAGSAGTSASAGVAGTADVAGTPCPPAAAAVTASGLRADAGDTAVAVAG
jgi:exonuclease SbcD